VAQGISSLPSVALPSVASMSHGGYDNFRLLDMIYGSKLDGLLKLFSSMSEIPVVITEVVQVMNSLSLRNITVQLIMELAR
jgi:hypothetical protein